MCKWPTCQLSKWMVCVGMEIGHYQNKWEPVSESATRRHLGLLGGMGQARIQSKNAAPLQLWLFVQPGTQQLYCHGISLDWLNPVAPNHPKFLSDIDFYPASHSFEWPISRTKHVIVGETSLLLQGDHKMPHWSGLCRDCENIVQNLFSFFFSTRRSWTPEPVNARRPSPPPPPPSPLLCVRTLQLQRKTRGLLISFNILLQLLFFRPPSLPLYPTTKVLEVFVELFAQMGSGDGLRLPVSFWSNPDHTRIAGLKISLSTGYSVVEPKKEID